ncbi:MAG: light-harvesting protein [Pseudomonadota bacterium]
MNNSKIWLVVNPSVGVPLFLSAVAVGSFAVHVAVLSNTGWVANFLKGEEMAAVQVDETTKLASSEAEVKDYVILADGRKALIVD